MKQVWEAVYDVCRGQIDPESARRLTNFVIAAAVGRTVTAGNIKPGSGELRAEVQALTSALSVDLPLPRCDWDELEAQIQPPRLGTSPSAFDAWVEAFQAADVRRKSQGAYATPSPFADVLAKGAILEASPDRIPMIVDPAAGAGNLLLAAHRRLVALGCGRREAAYALHGVELDAAARELCVLMIWLSAVTDEADPSMIASHIIFDNAVTRYWWSGSAFDILLMNPPWESLRPQGGEVHDEARLATLERIGKPLPGASDLPPLYTAHGRGDRNLFKAFVELAPHLLRPGGRLGALVPAAFGSDLGMADLRKRYLEQLDLESWTSFENRQKYFAIDSRYKFGLLFGTRSQIGTRNVRVLSFAEHPRDINLPHVSLRRQDLEVIGGPDLMVPELTSEEERNVLVQMLASGSPLFERGPVGSVRYQREVDLTIGRAQGVFTRVAEVPEAALCADLFGDQADLVPLLEGRMVGQYDCFQKSYVGGEARRAMWELNEQRPIELCRPQFVCAPGRPASARVALCDVTSATNTRTVLATLVPRRWRCGNTAPVLRFESDEFAYAALAILNSMTFDWMARRLVGGLHLNKFYLARFVWPRLAPEAVQRLSALGSMLATLAPRGGVDAEMLSKHPALDSTDRATALADVEYQVANGFGLTADQLSYMFEDSRDDRRGFWRYFAATPEARSTANLAVKALQRGTTPIPGRLAA